MEIGRIPVMDQYKDNKTQEMQQVKSSSDSSGVSSKKDLEQIQQDILAKARKNADVQEVKNESLSAESKFESVISNTNFGYNTKSKDFFVKVERGNIENQYPTQEMMKVKAYMLSLQADIG